MGMVGEMTLVLEDEDVNMLAYFEIAAAAA